MNLVDVERYIEIQNVRAERCGTGTRSSGCASVATAGRSPTSVPVISIPGTSSATANGPPREAQAQAPFLIRCIHELGNLGFLDVPVANDEEEEFDPTDPGDGDDPDCGA